MNDSKEMRELEKLSAGLAPKKTPCKMCRIILIATIILFVASLGLVILVKVNIPNATNNIRPSHIITPEEQSRQFK